MFPKDLTIEKLNQLREGAMAKHLGIEYIAVGEDFIEAKMPVDHRTKQPFGRLHGGASLTLAEELGSVAANMLLDMKNQIGVGLEINANHVRSAHSGFVTGKASPIHIGGKTHIWEIKIYDEGKQLICISRLTVAVLDKQK